MLLVFAALLVALGSLYTATANTVERVKTAEGELLDQRQEVLETDIEVTSAEFDQSADSLTVAVRNTGDTTLSVSDASVTVDSRYQPLAGFETKTVAGEPSEVWRPNETLRLVDQDTGAPLGDAGDHVRIVTGTGVAALSEVATV